MCHRKIFGKYWQLDDVLESALRLNLTHITAIQPSPLSLRFGMFSRDHTCPILANSIFPYFSHFSSIFHAVTMPFQNHVDPAVCFKWFLCGRASKSEMGRGSYAAVIHCCEMEGRWPEALRLLQNMDQRGRRWALDGRSSHGSSWVVLLNLLRGDEVQHSATRR